MRTAKQIQDSETELSKCSMRTARKIQDLEIQAVLARVEIARSLPFEEGKKRIEEWRKNQNGKFGIQTQM